MMNAQDHLLEDAEDLIICHDKRRNGTGAVPCGKCPWCEWRQNYLRFKTERENREAVELVAKLR